ncbi:MAG: FAD:protein FMN transferase [Candidatus Marinimicrobia bacterium]|nr:FAD:protein FMN transferase [Candidatus Neomarinimicrobiota bacterium]
MISLVKTNLTTKLEKARPLLGFLFLAWLMGCGQPKQYLEIYGETMGTTYFIRMVPDLDLSIKREMLKVGIDSILSAVDRQMSTYRLDSEISFFNKLRSGVSLIISDGFSNVLNRAVYWGEKTRGALDVTVLPSVLVWRSGKRDREYPDQWEPPTDYEVLVEMVKVGYDKINLTGSNLIKAHDGQMIDLNAIAKGWGVDQLFEYIRNDGVKNFMVEIGGEVRTLGKNNKGQSWKIGIDRPIVGTMPGENIYSVVSVSNQAMATSGNYRNFKEYDNVPYSHIINPRTGRPTQSNIASVTVVAPNCMDADALATALNVMEVEEGLELVESLDGFEAFWIIKENEELRSVPSSGMPIAN